MPNTGMNPHSSIRYVDPRHSICLLTIEIRPPPLRSPTFEASEMGQTITTVMVYVDEGLMASRLVAPEVVKRLMVRVVAILDACYG
ncbi:hypothetical protein GQ457_02G024120 [Hibiscus cannabinus]